MKKILLFLSFLLMSICVWGATTYTKITSNSSLSNGDKVILAQGSSTPTKGVTGWNGNKDATVSNTESSWVQYEVKSASSSGWQLYDATANNYIKSPGSSNQFLYGTAGTCSVSSDGVLMCNSRYLVQNGSYYRMYSSVGSYTPFYVWKVTTDTPTPSTYSVTYNSNGGSGTMTDPNSPYAAGATVTTLTNTFTKSGYVFSKWNTQAGGGGTNYNEGATFTINANTTLYAQWGIYVPPVVDCDGDYYDFSFTEIGSTGWGSSYAEHVVSYTNDEITFASASKQTGTITDIPVTKGGDIIVIAQDGKKISSCDFVFRQWTTKTQTITLWYSTDGGSTYTTTGVTSTNFRITYSSFDSNTDAIKITFSSSSSQIGVESLCIEHGSCETIATVTKGSEVNGTFTLDKSEVCADGSGGSVTVTYMPAEGYEFDSIEATVGTVVDNTVTNITGNTIITVHFKEGPDINIVEWNPDYVKIDIDNYEAVSAIIQNQNTQLNVENFADSLFFSKYFEAASNVKLLAVYNGTNHTIDISSYGIGVDDNGNGFSVKLFSEMVYRDVNDYDNTLSFTSEEMQLNPNEEIILISYQKNNAPDSAIIKCAKENGKSGFSKYYRLKTPELKFNGDDAIALVNPDGDFIDLIGAGTKADGRNITNIVSTTTTTGTFNGFMDNPGGWYSTDGINIETGDSIYALSTNRCLLIRKNRVKSGLDAVSRNTTDFVTLGGTYGEWRGLQIPGSTDGGSGAGVTNACTGFDDIGSFDYGTYYAQYESLDTIALSDGIYDSETGTYTISIPELDTLSCTNLKVIVSDGSTPLEKSYKIPIFVQDNISTTHETFTKEGPDCATCDVVVLNNKTLTVAGTSSANRDVKLYAGAKLIVPTSTSYAINSLALRRDNNTVSTLGLVGTLTLSHLYFDLYIDCKDWYYVALPDTFTLSKLKFANGKKVKHRRDYWVKYYDGKYRAETQSGSWRTAKNDTLFQPGAGFIIGLNDDLKKKELRFEFNATQTLLNERGNKTAGNLHAWGINNAELRPNHKGWNLVGNPYMNIYDTDFAKAIRAGYLYKDETSGTWNGQWLLSDTTSSKLRYAVIPSKDPVDAAAGGYKSVTLDERPLDPFICFFVQMGGANDNAQTLQFKQSQKRNSIVARRAAMFEDEEDDELFLRIKIGDNKTGCFISDQFSEKYEPGDDLESRYGHYQLINGYKLLYSAINDSIIENGVQVHSNGGIVTLDPKVEVDKFEEIYILVGETWYDLLRGDVPEVSSDFVLYAKRKVKEDIPTGIDNVKPGQGTYKFSYGEHVYINNNGNIYNMLGTKLK